MQYSVRTRRRLRPHTRDLTVPASGVVEPAREAADGSGAVKRPLVTQPVIERVSPRALATSWRR
ncbi:MAG: hypothetical protein IPQ07_08800 [Myxococcales bacterium]|nr:hypothetical protein [Myxococcales bacterium]